MISKSPLTNSLRLSQMSTTVSSRRVTHSSSMSSSGLISPLLNISPTPTLKWIQEISASLRTVQTFRAIKTYSVWLIRSMTQREKMSSNLLRSWRCSQSMHQVRPEVFKLLESSKNRIRNVHPLPPLKLFMRVLHRNVLYRTRRV